MSDKIDWEDIDWEDIDWEDALQNHYNKPLSITAEMYVKRCESELRWNEIQYREKQKILRQELEKMKSLMKKGY